MPGAALFSGDALNTTPTIFCPHSTCFDFLKTSDKQIALPFGNRHFVLVAS